MKKLKKKYLDVLERLDWSVIGYTDDGRVEIENSSPAGENLVICVDVKDFPMSVAEYSNNFDVDEHVEVWIEARQNGVAGVSPARILVHDAEDIEKMLLDLADALATA